MQRRAVITGIGILSPLGNCPEGFFSSALKGKSGIGPIRKFNPTAFSARIGGELDLSTEPFPSHEQKRETPAVAWWIVLASRKAVRDAQLDLAQEDPYSIDVLLGVSIPALDSLRPEFLESDWDGSVHAGHETAFKMNPAAAALQVSRDLGLHGEAANITTACSSSATAIGYAARQIQCGHTDCILTGGADEGVSKFFYGTFGKSCLSKRNDAPAHASRPFDRSRDGYVLSDAACILVLEEYERAKARGARVDCEISGFGAGSDAVSAFKLGKSVEPGARAIEKALRQARVTPGAIDYYCALGVAGPWVDIRETQMIKRVFSRGGRYPAVSSIKSMMGHPMGAAGAVQAATCALAIRHQAVPPTINYEEKDPECDLDYVPNEARAVKVRHAVAYTLGNGNNTGLVFSAC